MKSAPRVLQVCAVDFTARHFVAPVAAFLQKQGCEVAMACSAGPDFAYLSDQGFRMVELPIARSLDLRKHRQSYRLLLAHLEQERYDIVHAHTPVASFIARQAATKAGVPIRFYTAHGFYFHEHMPWPKRLAHVAVERFFARRCEHLFTVSAEDRDQALRKRIAPPEKVTYVGQGVDVALFDPERFSDSDHLDVRYELGIPHEATVATITGRLVREKGYFELIAAARELRDRLPHLYFLAIGDALSSDYDDSSQRLRQLVKEHGLEHRFLFAGLRDDVPALLAASDLFVLPSYREGMPVSVLEAMAMALPCVVTDIRGCREEVVDGECGFLAPVRQAAPLAEKIALLAEDRTLARRLGRAARERVLKNFRLEQYLERQWRVYEQFIDRKLS